MGPESAGIEVLVRKLLGENRKKLVFDVTAVDYIDSSGLGILTLSSAMMQAGGAAEALSPDQARQDPELLSHRRRGLPRFYRGKSTEDGLNQPFNTLDVQREAPRRIF